MTSLLVSVVFALVSKLNFQFLDVLIYFTIWWPIVTPSFILLLVIIKTIWNALTVILFATMAALSIIITDALAIATRLSPLPH
jgi:hypothetical protein